MNVLLVHQNFPGQFRGLAPELKRHGFELKAISMRQEPEWAGVQNFCYQPGRSTSSQLHPWLTNTESAIIRGEAAANMVQKIVAKGWKPDVVLGHTGWGEMLFMRSVLPEARILGFNELFYQANGGDVNFDPEFPTDPDMQKRLQVRNLHLLSSLLACDEAITATHWQANCFPSPLKEHIRVIHDGIRTDKLVPDASAFIRLNRDGLVFRPGDEVVTFINRNLEPMRGYHQFMRSLPLIFAKRPQAHVVIVGGDEVSYGAKPLAQKGYKYIYLDEVRDQLDMSRVHFVNRVPYETLISLLRVSAAHVYLTVPFVLSWSMLEAMSLGALIIGSDTPPVREVIKDGKNGLLVDFFNPEQIAQTVCDALAEPQKFAALRKAARQTIVTRYDFQTQSLPEYIKLIRGP